MQTTRTVRFGVFLLFLYAFSTEGQKLPRSESGKESPRRAGDPGSIPGLGRSPGEGNGNPRQCSCLGNPMDRGAWWATVHGVAELDMTEVTRCLHIMIVSQGMVTVVVTG